jgi:hypothetical protein
MIRLPLPALSRSPAAAPGPEADQGGCAELASVLAGRIGDPPWSEKLIFVLCLSLLAVCSLGVHRQCVRESLCDETARAEPKRLRADPVEPASPPPFSLAYLCCHRRLHDH